MKEWSRLGHIRRCFVSWPIIDIMIIVIVSVALVILHFCVCCIQKEFCHENIHFNEMMSVIQHECVILMIDHSLIDVRKISELGSLID